MSDFIPSVLMGNEILSASLSSETLESFWFTWVKSFIERKINNIDEGVWNRIKPEFKKISERFSDFRKFGKFVCLVTDSYQTPSVVRSIHQKWKKSSELESLYAEFMDRQWFSWLNFFRIRDKKFLSNVIDQVQWREESSKLKTAKKVLGAWNSGKKLDNQDVKPVDKPVDKPANKPLEIKDVAEKVQLIAQDVDLRQQDLKSVFHNGSSDKSDETPINYAFIEWVASQGLMWLASASWIPFSQNSRGALVSEWWDVNDKRNVPRVKKKNPFVNLDLPDEEYKIFVQEMESLDKEITQQFWETIVWWSLFYSFIPSNEEKIKKVVNSWWGKEEIRQLFLEWNKNKLENISSVLTDDNLKIFSVCQQMLKYKSSMNNRELRTRLNKLLVWEWFTSEQWKLAYQALDGYTLSEVVWELISKSADSRWRLIPSELKKLQLIAWCFADENNLFSVESDGIWWEKTFGFFDMIKDSVEFKKSPHYAEYRQKILLILDHNPKYNLTHSIYDTFDDSLARLRRFWSDPAWYWAEQWIDRSKLNQSIDEDKGSFPLWNISLNENLFIWTHSAILDWKITDLFDQSSKINSEDKINTSLNVLSVLPKDTCQEIVSSFFTNAEALKSFKSLSAAFGNIPDDKLQSTLVNYLTEIFNWEFPKDSSLQARAVLCQLIWTFYGSKINESFNEIKEHFKLSAWESALKARNEFLSDVLWFDVIQTSGDEALDNPEHWIFYFRDKDHPEALYKYNAEKWEIYVVENVSVNDWVITFSSRGTDRLVLSDVWKYSDLMGKIDVWEVLGLWGERAANIDELKMRTSERIKKYTTISKWYTDIVSIGKEFEVQKYQNEILSKLSSIFSLEDKISSNDLVQKDWAAKDIVQITKSDFGACYEMFNMAISSFRLMDVQDLAEFSALLTTLDDTKQLAQSWYVEDWQFTPLQKFILSNEKNKSVLKWKKIADKTLLWNWNGEDVLYWSILKSLIKPNDNADWFVFDSDKIFTLNNNSISEKDAALLRDKMEFEYSVLSHPTIASELQANLDLAMAEDIKKSWESADETMWKIMDLFDDDWNEVA